MAVAARTAPLTKFVTRSNTFAPRLSTPGIGAIRQDSHRALGSLSTRKMSTSHTIPPPQLAESYLADTRRRRTCYSLTNKSSISDERIHEIVKHAILHTPTSFNNQSLRAVILLKKHHKKFWDITLEALKAKITPDRYGPTEAKIAGFAAGYGTILYLTDMDVIKKSQEAFPSYGPNFPVWADNSEGIVQATVWTAFALEGLGASLQHYHPLIDEAVRKEWNLPESWKLSAQAPFGVPAEGWQPAEKAFEPVENDLVNGDIVKFGRVQFFNDD